MGRQSLFVRMRQCPLSCKWCDSKFTWDRHDPGYNQPYLTFDAAPFFAKTILDHLTPAIEAIVFTGGEPLIYQPHLPEVIDLVRTRGQQSLAVEIETAGTILPDHALLQRAHFNVSPKLASSGNAAIPMHILWNEQGTRRYLAYNDAIFKIVVAKDDVTSLEFYLSWLQDIATKMGIEWKRRVYLMPCATTPYALEVGQRFVLEHAQRLGVRATTRMHILAHGDERGR